MQINNNVSGREMFATKPGEGANLLGFGSVPEPDDEFQERGRGGRRGGNRGGDRGGRGGRTQQARPQQQQRQGGRKGGRIVNNEDEFPSL